MNDFSSSLEEKLSFDRVGGGIIIPRNLGGMLGSEFLGWSVQVCGCWSRLCVLS